MARYRLCPTSAQERVLRDYCAHARFVWNLAVEQQSWWRPGRKSAPSWAQRSRQLTEARREFEWLRAVPRVVQEQALRDFEQAMQNHLSGTHRRPTWRKAGRDEGFCIQGPGRTWSARRLSRTGEVVGIDRGVAVSAALSTGEMLSVPPLSPTRDARMKRLQRKLARAQPGSNRRSGVKLGVARLKARESDLRKDWCEKVSTDLARRFDVIRVEDLKIQNMTRSARGTLEHPGRNVRQKAGLNREIVRSGWGLLVTRLEQKAPGRVEKVSPAYTSQRCSACGHVDPKSRESQADFRCTACGFACNADVNAAKNIAAGQAVTARGGSGKLSRPVNREPQLLAF